MKLLAVLVLTTGLLAGCRERGDLPTGEEAREAVSEAANDLDSLVTDQLDSAARVSGDSLRAEAESLGASVRDRVDALSGRRDSL